jgi:dTDP-4-dehydrorhamnose reductase
MLGAFDWNSLVTRSDGHYEPGVFDLRAPEPRPTAIAKLTRELANGEQASHPVLDMPGWWRRTRRLVYAHALDGQVPRPSRPPAAARPLVITGATGTLGQAFGRRCELRGISYRLLKRSEMDIADRDSVDAALALHGPWAVINASGYVRVDDAERDRARCFRENADAAAILAEACATRGIGLVTFSSDLVFDGRATTPYDEGAVPRPLNIYGESKATAEARVAAAYPGAMIVRTSAFFGPWDDYNFLTRLLRSLKAGEECVAVDDAVVSPTYVPDLVDASLDLLIDGEHGVWHLANDGAVTWLELGQRAALLAGLDPARITPRHLSDLALPAARPRYSALASRRASIMPSLDHALTRYLAESGWSLETELAETAMTEALGA